MTGHLNTAAGRATEACLATRRLHPYLLTGTPGGGPRLHAAPYSLGRTCTRVWTLAIFTVTVTEETITRDLI